MDEQKERNIPGGGSYISFGMREYRAASMKGLSGAIEEVERGGGRQEQRITKPVEPEKPVKPAREEVDMGGEVPEDIMAHLDDLEAEILTALDDVNGDREPVETTDQPTARVVDVRMVERVEPLERPPPPAPKLKPTRATPQAVPVRPAKPAPIRPVKPAVREPPPVRRRLPR